MIKEVNLYVTIIMMTISFNAFSVSAPIMSCNTEECINYFKEFKRYARVGHSDAMTGLAQLYINGYGTNRDVDKALRYFRRGAKYGNTQAQYYAALIYLNYDKYQDLEKGISYLKKAARNKHGLSAYLLGTIYIDKKYGVYDLEQADKWLSKAIIYNNNHIRNFLTHVAYKSLLIKDSFPLLNKAIHQKTIKTNHKTEALRSDAVVTKNTQLVAQLENTAISDLDQGKIVWPEKDDIEVITVSPPSLVEIFDYQLQGFVNLYPDKYNTATGSKIVGRTCDKVFSCYRVSKQDMKRIFDHIDGI